MLRDLDVSAAEGKVDRMIYVDEGRCRGCGLCVNACPKGAIHLEGGLAVVDHGRCDLCEACVDVCPMQAIYPTLVTDRQPAHKVSPTAIGSQPRRVTGRRTGFDTPGFANAFGGRGMGRGGSGRGGGRFGRRNVRYATDAPGRMREGVQRPTTTNSQPSAPATTPQGEVEALRQQAKLLQRSLEEVNKKLGELMAREK